MAGWATGKYSKAISDRSGMEFPYNEMVREWNGSLVHVSEFEPKHPQIRRKTVTGDRIALQNPRQQDFQDPSTQTGVLASSGGNGQALIDLTLPGAFAYLSAGMVPDDGSAQNRERQLTAITGSVTVSIS